MTWIKDWKNWQLVTEQQDFKTYTVPGKPDWIYRRAGATDSGVINWQYQAVGGEKYWHEVENPESIKQLDQQYQENQAGGSPDYWTLIAIMACETFETQDHSGAKQAMADVAQAIYNRYNTPGQLYGKTIKQIILAPGQYQPVQDGLQAGAEWKTIGSKQDAIQVYMKTKSRKEEAATLQIEAAIQAQANQSLRSNAKEHVGSRTEFLAAQPSSNQATGMVERKPVGLNNCFYWRYAGKTQLYNQGQTGATNMPDSVKVG